jgi:hypothetical protein
VDWKKAVNGALARRGYRLERVRAEQDAAPAPAIRPGDRLLERPTFILCSVRSGSTLLRVLLSSHSMIHCPHELHLRRLILKPLGRYAREAFAEVGLDRRRLRYLLWDRVLQRELAASGKRLLVNKTPNDVFIVDRILECWPDARFIFLLRHPAAIARSRQALRPQDTPEENVRVVARYCDAVEAARRGHDGLTVRYEELAADPEAGTKRLCEFLGVPWERRMLDYGDFAHGAFKPGLGDWSENIRSGRVQPPAPTPDESAIPAELVELCRAWGYLDGQEPVPHASQPTTMKSNVETRAEPPPL